VITHEQEMKIVQKPWGRELWMAHGDFPYAFKILEVKAGQRLSLQYHEKKRESAYCLSGEGTLTLENLQTGVMELLRVVPGALYHVVPNQKHRLEAVTDLRIIEVSTPELDDVVRIADDHHRPDGHIEDEHTR
jgi:mannose-6-phosphate isomerase